MISHSLRVRLLLPILTLVLVVVAALTVVLAMVGANRVRSDTDQFIQRRTSSLQSLFAVTHSIMLERVHASMRLLRHEAGRIGNPSVGAQVLIDNRTPNDLLLGGTPQANNFALVDNVASIAHGTATIFSRSGDDFVRIATNVRKDDGSRAIGTVLDPQGKAIAQIRKGQGFYGVVDILGKPYMTGYEPVFAGSATSHPIGVWYVGYQTDLQALATVIDKSRVLESGFIAVFDGKGKLRFQSKNDAGTGPDEITSVVNELPADWVVTKQDIPDWDFTLIAAYPKSDVNRVIVRQSLWIASIGLLVCALLLGLQWRLIQNRVLRPIQRLTEVAEALSVGKWNHTIGETELKDEIGKLARAISRLSYSVRVAMEKLGKQR